MKKPWLFLFLIPIILWIGILFYYKDKLYASIQDAVYWSACEEPIAYKVDAVDSQFGVSRKEFLSDIERSVNVWSQTYGQPLFTYDPGGTLSINLVFDERQSISNRINQLESTVDNQKGRLESRIADHDRSASDFKLRLTNLNNKILFWNTRGGAPPDVYQEIIQEQEELQKVADRLNTDAADLNLSVGQYNAQIDDLNQEIGTFNTKLQARPEEGIYDGKTKKIEIYFYFNKNEFVHTIAHELGHALGMGHVQDFDAIMFGSTNQQLSPTTADIEELKTVCQEYSIFHLLRERMLFAFNLLIRSTSGLFDPS